MNRILPSNLEQIYSKEEKFDFGKYNSVCCLTFDCDYLEDGERLPELLEKLNSRGLKASFAVIGKWIEKQPKIYSKVLEQGHEIINHTYTHPNHEQLNQKHFDKLSEKEMTNEIELFDEISKNYLDYKATGFRAPHFGNQYTEKMYSILKEHGYVYSSSVSVGRSGHSNPYLINDIYEMPMLTCVKHPHAVFDSWHAFERGNAKHKEDFFDVFKESILLSQKYHSFACVYFDPIDISDKLQFDLILDHLAEQTDIWKPTLNEVMTCLK